VDALDLNPDGAVGVLAKAEELGDGDGGVLGDELERGGVGVFI